MIDGLRPVYIAVVGVLVTQAGCGDDEPTAPGPCVVFEDECVGVPPGGVCGDEFCTDGVACAAVVEVSSDAELAGAASAAPGTCFAVAAGSYGAVSLAGGVSLLGSGADQVALAGIHVAAGSGAVVRGVASSGTIRVDGADAARIEAVRVTGGATGIAVRDGAAVTIVSSEVTGTSTNAIGALDAVELTIDHSLVADNGGTAIWAGCSDGCACAQKPALELSHVLVSKPEYLGIGLQAVAARLDTVTVLDTRADAETFAGGGGVAATDCTELEVSGLRIDGADAYGMLVDASSGSIGAPGEDAGIVIVNGKGGGLWIQNVMDGLHIEGFTLESNLGVGLDVSGSLGIVIVNGHVGPTPATSLPIVGGGMGSVGDGVVWSGTSTASITGLELAGSERNAFLIDGPVGEGSSLADVTLSGGDESKGIVQQQVMMGDTAPTVENAPAIDQQQAAVSSVPAAVDVPVAQTVE
jgi:parallel beta helix pectate lyase-like protein